MLGKHALGARARAPKDFSERRQHDDEPPVEAVELRTPVLLDCTGLEDVVDRNVVARAGERAGERAAGFDGEPVLLGLYRPGLLRVGATRDDERADLVELDVGGPRAPSAPGPSDRRFPRAGRPADERDDRVSGLRAN